MVSAEVLRERKALAEEVLRKRFEIARNKEQRTTKEEEEDQDDENGETTHLSSIDTTSPTDTVETNDDTNNNNNLNDDNIYDYEYGYAPNRYDDNHQDENDNYNYNSNTTQPQNYNGDDDDNNRKKKKHKKKSSSKKKSKKSDKKHSSSKKSSSKKSSSKRVTILEPNSKDKKKSKKDNKKQKDDDNDNANKHDTINSVHVKGFSGLGYAVLWFFWLLSGTFWFGYVRSDLGLFKGFFMAVNVGYSIGWGYPVEQDENLLYISSLYLIIGSSFVAIALGFFAQKIVEDADNWFAKLSQKQEYERDIAPGRPFLTRVNAFRKYHKGSIRAIGLWILWISIMILYSMINVKWSFAQAQYFAISSCSTGGLWGLPDDSPDFVFGVTGFFACLGVPIMGIAMTKVAKMFVSTGDVDDLKATLAQTVTEQEIRTLNELGLEDGDGIIEKSEFIILCMMRLGTDPGVIQFITEQFNKLDVDGDGTLTLQEITKRKSITLERVLSKANMQKHLMDLDLDDDSDDDDDYRNKDPGV